jgi:capsular polysaccharide biosynthesis protein
MAGEIIRNRRQSMELELKDYLGIVKKRLWIVIAVVLLACLTAGIISYMFVKPVYQASTKLIVNKSTDAQLLTNIDLNSLQANIRLIDTYKEIIKTPAILDKVALNFPDIALNADQLNGRIQVTSVNDTQVMTITAVDFSQARAAKIANAVAAVFKEQIPVIMKVDNITILNEAKPDPRSKPINYNPNLTIAITFVVALILSLGIVFLMEYLDDTVKSEKDVEHFLGVPTLAVIRKAKEDDFIAKNRRAATRMVGDQAYVSTNQ